MTRRLLVLDRADPRLLADAVALSHSGDEWGIVLFGDSPTLVGARARDALDRLGRWRFVPLERFADAAHREVAAFVPGFVRDLPLRDLGAGTLGALLGHRWWFLETTERSPFRGSWIGSLYRLALVLRALASEPFDELVVATGDAELRRLLTQDVPGRPPVREIGPSTAKRPERSPLRYLRSALFEARRLLVTLLLVRLAGIGGDPPARGALAAYTTHPYFWLDAFGARATERFLPALPPGASYLGWIDDPRTLWRRRAAARAVFRAKRIVPLARWLGPLDALALLSPGGLVRLLRFRRLRGAIRGRFRGYEIGSLVADDLERSLASPQLFFAELVFRAVRRFAQRSAPAAVLYRLELQPWENAIVLALRGVAPSVGFRHTPFGELYLPVRLAPGEVASRPLPDRVIASGPLGAERLAAEGYPAARIAVCGPQRHPALVGARARADPPDGPFTVYVAISTVLEETVTLIGALVDAFAELPDALLVLRTHPALALSADTLARLLAEAGLAGRWSPAPPDLYEGLARCHALVTTPSTLAFEAVALGIAPVVFENPGTYNANSVAEHDDAFFITRSSRELASALRAVHDGAPVVTAKRERWGALLAAAFSDLATPLESQLASALRAVGVDAPDEGGAHR